MKESIPSCYNRLATNVIMGTLIGLTSAELQTTPHGN